MRRLLVASALLAGLTAGSQLWAHPGTAARELLAGAPSHSRGTNILLVGIDSRAGLSREEINRLHVGGKGCNCTDVMMLVHLSADARRASVVSIPRDSYTEYAPHGHPRHLGKINGAFADGGGPLTVRTVEQATGLHVDHYLQTDFSGFESTVNRLGGAKVCTDRTLTDENSGLDLAPGTHQLDGRVALRYARARHVAPYSGDLGRVRRQQRLVVEMLSRLTAEKAFAGPSAALHTARTVLQSVTTDKNTHLGDLVRIGLILGRLSARQTEFMTVPISDFDHRVPNVGSTLVWEKDRSRALWDALRNDRPFTGDSRIQPPGEAFVAQAPSSMQARVDDAEVAAALRRNGFVVQTVAVAPGTPPPAGPTVITHDPLYERQALSLAAALPGAVLRSVEGHGSTLDVAVGDRGRRVVTVTHDRSSVEGAAVTGSRLTCDFLMKKPTAR
ncbi:LCP family protein [Streptomyces sp. NPDC048337]|uniref:LCP family protein n=1 Tax=Streptomyces sp. NPDC048337 TaxID=3365535 RepID=UPI00370FAC10